MSKKIDKFTIPDSAPDHHREVAVEHGTRKGIEVIVDDRTGRMEAAHAHDGKRGYYHPRPTNESLLEMLFHIFGM